MKLNALLLGGLTALVSLSAVATDDTNRTINTVGVTSVGAYVDFKEGTSGGCLYNLVYLPDPASGPGKSMLAVLLNAQTRGATLSTVSYSVATTGICTATNIRSN